MCAAVRARLAPLVAERIADADRRIAELSAFTAHLGPGPPGADRPGTPGGLRAGMRRNQLGINNEDPLIAPRPSGS